MSRQRRMLRIASSISAAMLLSIGLTASAHALPNWLIEGNALEEDENVLLEAHSGLVLVVPGQKLEIRCTFLTSESVELLGFLGGSGEAWGESAVTNCNTYSPIGGTIQKNCKPKEPILPDVKAKLILHESRNYVLLKEDIAKSRIAVIEVPELCALTETSEITGSAVIECGKLSEFGKFSGQDCDIESVTHLIREAPAELFAFSSHGLKFGENAAAVSGIAAVKLELGGSWAGHV